MRVSSRPQPRGCRPESSRTRAHAPSLTPWETRALLSHSERASYPCAAAWAPGGLAHHAPHPVKPIAWMTVKTNWAPKMKKNAMKLKELSALERERTAVTAARVRQDQRGRGSRPPQRCQPERAIPRCSAWAWALRGHHTASLGNTAPTASWLQRGLRDLSASDDAHMGAGG